MKMVINLPDGAYNMLLTEQKLPRDLDLEYLIMHGIPLPEGHGKWISEKVDGEDWKGCKREYYQPISCSKCHSPSHYKSTYCPNCGAKMESEE